MNSPTRRWNMFVALLLTLSVITLGGLLQLYSNVFDTLGKDDAKAATIHVVMAARDLPPGVEITGTDLQLMEVPESLLPAYRDKEAEIDWTVDPYVEIDDVVGRRPRLPILAGELIRAERLADGPTGKGLNALIAPRMRAYSVGTSGARALGGLLEPGARVDILVRERGDDGRTSTRSLLQDVGVVAVNARLEDEEKTASRQKSSSSVAFLVSPEQVELLALRSPESLSLTLRNGLDSEQEPLDVANHRALFAPRSKPAPKKVVVRTRSTQPARSPGIVTIRKGNKVSEVEVEDDEVPAAQAP